MNHGTIINGDCLEVLGRIPVGTVKAMFADVPDNIGLLYNTFDDSRMDRETYYLWLRLLIMEVLPRCQIFWLSYNAIHDLEVCWMVRDILRYRHPGFGFNKFLWTYTFNQYNDSDCAYGYRPILRLMRAGVKMYVDSIRENSERMLMGDARAAGPRVPNNVWSIPRVTGNSWERVPEIPTQHPIKLMERIVNLSVCGEEVFVDLFGGSGSSLRGAIGDRRVVVVEQDAEYCRLMAKKVKVDVVQFNDSFKWGG